MRLGTPSRIGPQLAQRQFTTQYTQISKENSRLDITC